MAKVVITQKNGTRIEVSDIDLTIAQLRELAGLNGHTPEQPGLFVDSTGIRVSPSIGGPDYDGFKEAMTDKAKMFFEFLSANPNGISNEALAEQLGFENPTAIGGMLGGGVAKIAPKFRVALEDLYSKGWDDHGTVIFKPGRDIKLVTK